MLQVLMCWLGFGLCHQLADRSYSGGGVRLPVCARDTGIYVGFVVSLALITALDRGRHRFGGPPAWVIGVAVVLFGAMAWDGVTSYAGLRETTNAVRLFTGTGAGFALAVAIAPMLAGQLWHRTTAGAVLGRWWEGALWVAAAPITALAMLDLAPLAGIAYPIAVALCILVTFSAVNLVVVALIPRFERRAERARDLLLPVTIAFAVALAEIALSAVLKVALLSLVWRG